MDSELPSFLVWALCIKCLVYHEVNSVLWSCLLPFLCNFLICTYRTQVSHRECSVPDRNHGEIMLNPIANKKTTPVVATPDLKFITQCCSSFLSSLHHGITMHINTILCEYTGTGFSVNTSKELCTCTHCVFNTGVFPPASTTWE